MPNKAAARCDAQQCLYCFLHTFFLEASLSAFVGLGVTLRYSPPPLPLSPPLTPSFSSPVFLCRWNKGWFWHPGAWCHYAGSWKRYRWVDSWCVFFFFFPLCVLLFSSAPLTHIATWFKTVCPNLFGSAPLQTKQCQLATSRHRLPKFPVCCKSKDFFFFPSFWDWQCNGLLSMCKTWLYKTTVFQKP